MECESIFWRAPKPIQRMWCPADIGASHHIWPTAIIKDFQLPPLIVDYSMDPAFVNTASKKGERNNCLILSLSELKSAEKLWWRIAQRSTEIDSLDHEKGLSPRSKILPFHPFPDEWGLLCVSGRLQKEGMPISERHPVLFPGNHKVTKLLITSKHLCLLHTVPTLVSSSLSGRFTTGTVYIRREAGNSHHHQPICNLQEGCCKASNSNLRTASCRLSEARTGFWQSVCWLCQTHLG